MQTKKDTLRNAILAAAEKEFVQNGYEKASMRRIAEAAGTGTGNLYHYFPGKEHIYAELVEEPLAEVRRLFSKLKTEKTSSFLSDISDYRLLVPPIRRWVTRFDILYTPRVQLLLTAEEQSPYAFARTEITELLTDAILHLTARKDTSSARHYPMQTMVGQVIDGLLETAKLYGDNRNLKTILRNQLTTAVAGFYIMLN